MGYSADMSIVRKVHLAKKFNVTDLAPVILCNATMFIDRPASYTFDRNAVTCKRCIAMSSALAHFMAAFKS